MRTITRDRDDELQHYDLGWALESSSAGTQLIFSFLCQVEPQILLHINKYVKKFKISKFWKFDQNVFKLTLSACITKLCICRKSRSLLQNHKAGHVLLVFITGNVLVVLLVNHTAYITAKSYGAP